MLKRKDGRWVEKLTVNGKAKYVYGKTKRELQEKLRDLHEIRERGMTFASVIADWKEDHYPSLVPSTQRGYEASRKRAIERFGNKSIRDIRPSEINAFLKSLASKGYGKKVVSTQLNVLNMVFNYAIFNEMIMSNPCQAVKVPMGLKHEKRNIPDDSVIEVVKNSDWLFPVFILYTGCRRGEALGIKYEDIDFENKMITVQRAVGYKDNVPFIKPPKTESGVRQVPLLPPLESRLERGKTGYVFKKNGGLYHDSAIRKEWDAWRERSGVCVTAHQLRHYYATILYDAGIEIKDAQFLMGHANISMTMDVYTHVRNSRQKDAQEKLTDYILKVSK